LPAKFERIEVLNNGDLAYQKSSILELIKLLCSDLTSAEFCFVSPNPHITAPSFCAISLIICHFPESYKVASSTMNTFLLFVDLKNCILLYTKP
jgi:hypothetical protein